MQASERKIRNIPAKGGCDGGGGNSSNHQTITQIIYTFMYVQMVKLWFIFSSDH